MKKENTKATNDHVADPIWGKFYNKLICKKCGLPVIGEGTIGNPWRHKTEKLR